MTFSQPEYAAGQATEINPEKVPLGTGPPTREELIVYYPPKFTFQQLKTFINSGCVHVDSV